MPESAGVESGRTSAVGATLWAAGAVCVSVVLGNLCIAVGAVAALVLEAGLPIAASVAVNLMAFGLMIAAYTLGLLLLCRFVSARWKVPFAVWPALALYPLVWAVLVALPGEAYAAVPAVVTGFGALAAWMVFGRTRSGADSVTRNDASPG